MSTRAKWIACIVAVVVVGLVASIPAFIGRSSEPRGASYAWLERVPVAHGPTLPDPSTPIGTGPNGQQLLATRIPDGEVCMRFGHAGRQCVAIDKEKQIQLVAKVSIPAENVYWGVVGDDVSAIRVRLADGSATTQGARRGFGVLETRAGRIVSIAALDERGRRVGSASGDVPVRCVVTSCVTNDVS
jgi:hypothetical protein